MSKHLSGSKDSEEKDDPDTDDLVFPDNRSADYLPPTPPDGGWGWIVCLASFVCNLIVDGVCYTFAIFAGEIQNHFESSKSKTALVGSMVPGFYLIVGWWCVLISSLATISSLSLLAKVNHPSAKIPSKVTHS